MSQPDGIKNFIELPTLNGHDCKVGATSKGFPSGVRNGGISATRNAGA